MIRQHTELFQKQPSVLIISKILNLFHITKISIVFFGPQMIQECHVLLIKLTNGYYFLKKVNFVTFS